MKKLLFILIIILNISAFSQNCYDVPIRTIPEADSASVYLNGSITNITGSYYFQDISGNARNFLINNYDFDSTWTEGFPYKSSATISAPVGDATLIAEDLNNFLYDVGGNPNQIPVISFFQDIDYEHKFFCRHREQSLNEYGVEFYAPRVLEIVVYNHIQTGSDLTDCINYYNVPKEALTNVRWATKLGDNTTGNGTKLLPWLTANKVDDSSTNGDTTYFKTGLYDETNYLSNNKLIEFNGLGFNTMTSTGTTNVILTQTNGKVKFNRWIVDGEKNTTTPFYLFRNNGEINSCYIKNSLTTHLQIASTSVGDTINNTIFCGKKEIKNAAGLYLNTCFIDSAFFSINAGSSSLTLLNCRIKACSTNYAITIGYNVPVVIKGCDITVNQAFNFVYSTINNIASNLYFTHNKVHGISFSSYGLIRISKSFANIDVSYNNIVSDSGITVSLADTRNSTIEKNIIDAKYLVAISISETVAIGGKHKINNNRLLAKHNAGYNIAFGSESTGNNNTIDTITISNNFLRGNDYYNITNNTTCHGILIGYEGVPCVIKHNLIEYHGMTVLKGTMSDYSDCHYFGNVIRNQQSYGIYIKSVDSANIINNTLIENGVELFFSENAAGDTTKGTIVKNNIMINTTGMLVQFLTTNCSHGHTFDYNIYYSTIAEPFQIGANTYTFSEWQALGYDPHSIFLTVNQFNNLFTDYTNGDYSLKTGSEAIGKGYNLGVIYDMGLSKSTNWGSDNYVPTIILKQRDTTPGVTWDCGSYIY